MGSSFSAGQVFRVLTVSVGPVLAGWAFVFGSAVYVEFRYCHGFHHEPRRAGLSS